MRRRPLAEATDRKSQCRFPCPKCGHRRTKAVTTGDCEGVAVRRRQCEACKHRFYTAQEPEYLLADDRIYWFDGRPQMIFDDEL